ncbi:MAG: beta-N-acetylhexosaminidase [Alphaproteobacteria bacterium]|nr:beta-N-acetylhexosaminidase [Alphaproteobacteria bacterium]
MTPPRAAILGLAGPVLAEEERRFFADADPLGVILFKRNCETPAQLKALVAALRSSVGRTDAPVLIDQEGGRVARLGAPHWRQPPAAATFAALAEQDLALGGEAARQNARLMAADLAAAGINVDCAPVLDLPVPGAHDVIGQRAHGRDPDMVATLGRAVCEGLLEGGVLPVIKHMPGHGRATVDTHHALPVVATGEAELRRTDFAPFQALNDMPWGMTAHVVYSAIDPDRPATTSRMVIERVIRGHIGFAGVLVTDDLSMQALSGTVGERAAAALAAGCDVALHCNGKMDEMRAVMAVAPALAEATLARLERGHALLHDPHPLDPAQGLARLEALMAGRAAAEAWQALHAGHSPHSPLRYA